MVLLVCLAAGCGYHLTGTSILLPDNIRTMAVPVFRNKTDQPAIEQPFTDAMVERFLSLPKIEITSPDKAQAIFVGTIRNYSWSQPLAFDNSLKVTEYRLEVVMDAYIKEAGTNRILWERKNIRQVTEFSATGGISNKRTAETEAVKQLAGELARRVFGMLEGF